MVEKSTKTKKILAMERDQYAWERGQKTLNTVSRKSEMNRIGREGKKHHKKVM